MVPVCQNMKLKLNMNCVAGMSEGIVSDLMGGRLGPVPMDIAMEAAAMAAAETSPDHIADILGDKLQARWGRSGF